MRLPKLNLPGFENRHPKAVLALCVSCHFHDNYIILFCCSLAATIVEAGRDKKNPDEFAVALDETLGDFAFPDEFVFDVWGAIGDAKQGRLG